MKKDYKAWLILDWKSGQMWIRRTLPTNLSPREIPIQVLLHVNAPDIKPYQLEAEVDIPEAKIEQLLAMQG